jgi:NTE family protein
VSIGGINGAIIAGNPPKRRLEQLRAFWYTVTARPIPLMLGDGDSPRRIRNALSAWFSVLLGQPGFFTPNIPNPWLSFPGAKTATSFYNTEQLRTTLLKLVDFERLNSGETRYAAGAVNVLTGSLQYFEADHGRRAADITDDELVAIITGGRPATPSQTGEQHRQGRLRAKPLQPRASRRRRADR